MTKVLGHEIDSEIIEDVEVFLKKMDSQMHFQSNVSGNAMSFEWVDIVETTCPYLDNVVRNPKLLLVTEENIEKIEKTKKVTVETIKNLSKHTYFINKIDAKTGDVEPEKLLDIRGMDTFNTYENRFLYTLLDKLNRFINKRCEELDNLSIDNNKVLEYQGKTVNQSGKIDIKLKLNVNKNFDGEDNSIFAEELNSIKPRIEKIRKYTSIWGKSDFIKGMIKERAAFVKPPFTKTNIILKNPNFQMAMKLWDFLAKYDENSDNPPANDIDTKGDEIIKGLLDHTFLIDYLTLKAICNTKKEEKEELKKYGVVIINAEIKRIVSLLFNLGIKIDDEDIKALIADTMKEERTKDPAKDKDIKDKFKSAMNEYLERTQDFLQ